MTEPDLRSPEALAALDRCSVASTLEALGDRWSVLVLRELFFGVHRFSEMQARLGISRSVLTERLTRLVDLGVVRTRPYQEPGERARHEYHLTRKGVDLLPVMVALMQWGDAHLNGGHGPVELRSRANGQPVRLELRTDDGPVQPAEIEPRLAR